MDDSLYLDKHDSLVHPQTSSSTTTTTTTTTINSQHPQRHQSTTPHPTDINTTTAEITASRLPTGLIPLPQPQPSNADQVGLGIGIDVNVDRGTGSSSNSSSGSGSGTRVENKNSLAVPAGITIIPPSPLSPSTSASISIVPPAPFTSNHHAYPSSYPSSSSLSSSVSNPSAVAGPSTQRLRSSTFSPPPSSHHRREETFPVPRPSQRPHPSRSQSHIVAGKRGEPGHTGTIRTNSSVQHHPLKRLSIDEYSVTTSSDIHTPTQENGHSGIHRRRPSLTNGSNSLQQHLQQTPPRNRQQSLTGGTEQKLRSPVTAPVSSSSLGWLSGNRLTLPPTQERHSHSKSDDERTTDEDETDNFDGHVPYESWSNRKRSRFDWRMQMNSNTIQYGESSSSGSMTPSISMTPPDSKSSTMPMLPQLPSSGTGSPPRASAFSFHLPMGSAGLQPLPQDPYNILPLSLPSSPFASPSASRAATPLPSAHPSMADLAAEYAASALPPAPSGSGSSPRTSISTSSSRYGWGTGRSDSRSSEDDDVVPPIPISTSKTRSHPAWWRNDNKAATEGSGPAPRIIRIASSSKFVPSGTRNWGWLFGMIPSLNVFAPTQTQTRTEPAVLPRKNSISAKARNREKDRLMVGPNRRRRDQKVLGSKWLARAMSFVPTQPLSISLFLLFVAVFAVTLTFTLKHILNPDKEALPWRQYCTSDYPTLYSLQDPTLPPPYIDSQVRSNHAFPSSSDAEIPYNSFAPSSSKSLTLMPLTPEHPAWPYHPHLAPPYSAEMDFKELDDAIEPVGVLIGVFTTDAGVDRRHMIRQSYASHWRSRREGTEGVKVRFVMGRPRKRFEKAVQLEMEAFNDILLLDIEENMNSGKTHAFFSWAAENATVPSWEYPKSSIGHGSDDQPATKLAPVWKGEKKPHYVVKADDDSFIMLTELEKRLRVAPRNKAFWGYLVKNSFMAGECYALSLDLVQYIGASPALRTLTRGKEDKLVAKWMNMHPEREQIVWVTERCWIYDHPRSGTVYSHGFLFPSTVAQVRMDNTTGLAPEALAIRGGAESADAYSTVSKFGVAYRPLSEDMSAGQRVEALIEGSGLSLLRDEIHRSGGAGASNSPDQHQQTFSHTESIREKINRVFASRPSRSERFLGDPEERGGTVVVHYIKKPEWFVETAIALLGGADDQSVWHRGVSMGLGAMERRKGRLANGMDEGRLESVHVAHGGVGKTDDSL